LIVSADALPDNAALTADLAVVGTGPAGIVIALEAARNGLDVLLIESGREKFSDEAQRLSEAADWDRDLHDPMPMSVRRQLGGTSTIWGGRCVPYDRVDFDRRAYISTTAWPVSYDELTPYFQRACDWLRCGRAVFNAADVAHLPPAMVPGLRDGAGSTATLERWTLSTDFGREHADALRQSARIRVVTGLTCTEVISRPGATRAEQLACRTLAGRRASIRARCYALACGGLETTRLLLASRGPHGGALGDHSGHLGSWYMGHAGGVISKVRFTTPPRATIFGYERDVDGTYVRRRFSVSRAAQREHELPNAVALLANPDLADYRHQNGVLSLAYLALRSPLGRLLAPPEHRMPITAGDSGGELTRAHLKNVARDCASVARFAAGAGARRAAARGHKTPGLFAAYSQDNRYPLQYHAEQVPSRLSRVSLASDRDSVGMRKLKIEPRFSPQDVDGVLRCHRIWDEYLRGHDCGYLEYSSPDPESAIWASLGGMGTHQLGTTRMAARAEDGVVNERLAVHGVDNLFVASSSTFLTSGQANPTFMIVVLALRLADWLSRACLSFDPEQPSSKDEKCRP
jgi:choline dehydrogenase-like flavoprotein